MVRINLASLLPRLAGLRRLHRRLCGDESTETPLRLGAALTNRRKGGSTIPRERHSSLIIANLPMAKTAGENLFESYLASIGLGPAYFEYEPAIGRKAPDYLVHGTQNVLCEVEDFGEGDRDRQIAAIPVGQARGGAFEPHIRIREKLGAAARQLREFKNRFPAVIVLYNPGFFVHLDKTIVAGAMYGNLQFVVEIGAARGAPGPTQTRFDRKKAKLRPQQNTTISAVAVLDQITPNFHLIEEVVQRHAEESRAKGMPTVESAVEAYELIQRFKASRPDIDFDLTVPRLRTFHNLYAVLPLDAAMFAGPHDEHFYPDPTNK